MITSPEYYKNEIKEKEYELCEASLYYFFKKTWELFNTVELEESWYLECIAEHLQAQFLGEESLRKLIINIPPRMGKTHLCSKAYPCWIWLHDKRHKVMSVCNKEDLAEEMTSASRLIIQHDWYQNRWNIPMRDDMNIKSFYENIYGGQRIATTPKSVLKGKGFNTCILDDPQDFIEDVLTEERKKERNFYSRTIKNRADNFLKAKFLLVQQRLGFSDLTQYIKETDPEFFVLKIPMEYKKHLSFTSPLNPDNYTSVINDPRKEDALLTYTRYSVKAACSQKEDLFAWNTMYQQDVSSVQGNLILDKYLKYYSKLPNLQDIIISVDTSEKSGKTNDFFSAVVLGKYYSKIYVLDYILKKCEFYEQYESIKKLIKKYKNYHKIIIEDRNNGRALYNNLKNKKYKNLILHNPGVGRKSSKLSRLYNCLSIFKEKLLYLPEKEEIKETKSPSEFLTQLLKFPTYEYDDAVDSLTQGLNYLIYDKKDMPKKTSRKMEPNTVKFDRYTKTELFGDTKINF